MTNTPCLTLVLIGTGKTKETIRPVLKWSRSALKPDMLIGMTWYLYIQHSGKLPVGNHKNKLANHVGQGHTERNEMRNQIYENSYK